MHKDLLPGDFDVVAQDHAVGFVVAIGKGCIELHRAHTFHRFARPQGQSWRVTRNRICDGLFVLVWRQRYDGTNPDLIGQDRASGKHFHAGDHHTIVFLAHNTEGWYWQVLPVVKRRITGGLGRQYSVDRVDVVVADVPVVGQQMVRMTVRRREVVDLHGHAGDEAGDVIRRPS